MNNHFSMFDKITLAAIVFFCLIILGLAIVQICEAERPWPQWDAKTRLALGRCLKAEAEDRRKDWSAASHVLIKRWRIQRHGWSFREQVERYCAVYDRRSRFYYSARSKQIRISTFENPKHGKRAHWNRIEKFVDRFAQKKIPDPCPRCKHWAGNIDYIPPTWTCPLGPPETANHFCHEQR